MQTIINGILGGFTNWQTTATSIIGATVYLLHSLHVVDISPTQQTALVTVFIMVFGWIAKDSGQTGTPTDSGE